MRGDTLDLSTLNVIRSSSGPCLVFQPAIFRPSVAVSSQSAVARTPSVDDLVAQDS